MTTLMAALKPDVDENTPCGVGQSGCVEGAAWSRRPWPPPAKVVRHQHPKHAAEERPHRVAAGDHIVHRLAVGQPHEHVAAEHRGEDQRVDHPPPPWHRVVDQAHAGEVDLHLTARLAVGHPHRRALPPIAQLVGAEAVQRPLGDLDATPGQQVGDLDHRHAVVQPP